MELSKNGTYLYGTWLLTSTEVPGMESNGFRCPRRLGRMKPTFSGSAIVLQFQPARSGGSRRTEYLFRSALSSSKYEARNRPVSANTSGPSRLRRLPVLDARGQLPKTGASTPATAGPWHG